MAQQPIWPPFPSEGRYNGLVTGYPRIAGEMSTLLELALFRRFGALNTRNLLYLQNELASLERALKQAERQDSMDPRGRKAYYARDFHCLDISGQDGPDAKQPNIFLRIREKLEEYNKCVYISRG
jgi:hypothetical protein